jgi:anti-sigma factor ChrR (cupin superfamily)
MGEEGNEDEFPEDMQEPMDDSMDELMDGSEDDYENADMTEYIDSTMMVKLPTIKQEMIIIQKWMIRK